MPKIHLDTDIGGDMDDFCALAMLLKWPGLQITGITTVAEERGRRAGFADYVLKLMNRPDIPFAAGADVGDGLYRYPVLGYPPDEVNWPGPLSPQPGPIEEALTLLKKSIEQGAILVGIGPYTNFRLLDERYPGILKEARIVLMGGNVYPPPSGFPVWSNEDDWNIQVDVPSARYVFEHSSPTLVPVTVTAQTALRRAYLPRLIESGPLGALIARQAEHFAESYHNEQTYGETCPRLPRDIINFQHDPLACAIALGWDVGVEFETVPLRIEERDSWLHEIPSAEGLPMRLVTKIDGPAFNEFWLETVCR